MTDDHKYPNFIDDGAIESLIESPSNDLAQVQSILDKSMAKEPLTVEETAVLINTNTQEATDMICDAARELKKRVYGNRIVLFAPLYIGNHCINDCKYCAFRKSLRSTVRKTLSPSELKEQVTALEDVGHKRLILVFGEHPSYTPEFIAETVRDTYAVKHGNGEIRRVNINAAPLDHDGYKTVKASGIGTYQIFQETYHAKTYGEVHPPQTHKGDYMYRLHGLTRAYEAGCDDVGIGALFGLYDWRFEVLSMITHSRFLMDRFGCGPHTISFPRIRPANGMDVDTKHFVSDKDFAKLVAILRLAVPYTGLILTAREPAEIRREVLEFGVSQVDAGTRIELAGYTKKGQEQDLTREQFQIGDLRSLDEMILDLVEHDFVPSFCTSCYRKGRTGEHFMEYAIPGFIQNFCTPNAMFTLAEYLEDYSSEETKKAGMALIQKELAGMAPDKRAMIEKRLQEITGEAARDIYL
jgi:2-iminoacetate synthase